MRDLRWSHLGRCTACDRESALGPARRRDSAAPGLDIGAL